MIAFIISRVRLEEREVRYSGNTRGNDNAEVDPVTTGRQPWQKRRQKKIEPGKKDKNQGDLEAGICKKLCKMEKTRRKQKQHPDWGDREEESDQLQGQV